MYIDFTKTLALLSSACKLGIIGAYNLSINLFDALYNDLKDSSTNIIPEDLRSREANVAALVVMSEISIAFLSHDINRKTDLVKILLSDDRYAHKTASEASCRSGSELSQWKRVVAVADARFFSFFFLKSK